jgi:hypothetical protein
MHLVECILRDIFYENIENTILLVHDKMTIIQCSKRMSICFSRFKVIVELSCHSIFVELLVSIGTVL